MNSALHPLLARILKTTLCAAVVLGSSPVLAQTASYLFEGNLDDSSNSYDATASGTTSFESGDGRNYLSLGADGVVAMPAGLSTAVFSGDSFEFSFDFWVEDGGVFPRLPMLVSAKSTGGETGWWVTDPGFVLFMHVETWGPELIFNFSDGQMVDEYVWEGFSAVDTGQWHTINLSFNFESNFWRIILDGESRSKPFPADFDGDLFKTAMQAVQITAGGIDTVKLDPYFGLASLDNLEIYAPARSHQSEINTAYGELSDDLLGNITLTEPAREAHLQTLQYHLYFTGYTLVEAALLSYTQTYESLHPPMYEDGVAHTFDDLTVHERVLQFSQSYVFDTQFMASNIDNVAGLVFEHSEVIPGKVPPETPRVASMVVELDGSYQRDKAAMLTDQARVVRPTGSFLTAGDIVTIRVPESVIDQGLSVLVGHHFRNQDYDYIGTISRFPDISVEYALNATEIRLASPFGGGIYLKVPEDTSAGWFSMTIDNAIRAPYFSWRDGRHSDVANWLQVVANTGAPWADFESDKMMFTLPTSELDGITNPDAIMARWDEIMDAISLVGGRPSKRPRAEYYTVDTRLVTPAYGAGYPMVIPESEVYRGSPEEGWDPMQVLNYKPHKTMLHEMGHNHLQPTLGYGGELDQCHSLEAETIVHMLAMSVFSNVYGLSKDEAFKQSASQLFSFDQAAFDWIITSNFRSNTRMHLDEEAPMEDTEQLKYQNRGHAKYGDVARLFGWEGISAVNARFYTADQEQESTVCNWRPFVVGRDEYIREASAALGVNMTPLFHFWGINPSPELALEMEQYPRSVEVYNLLVHYRDNVAPKTMNDYLIYHNQFPTGDYQYPRYEQYLIEFDEAFAAAIAAQFELLISTYFDGFAEPIFSDGFE